MGMHLHKESLKLQTVQLLKLMSFQIGMDND